MDRNHLVPAVRARLKRYAPPFDNHYGVVPAAPTTEPVDLGSGRAMHAAALEAIGRANGLARSYPNHFLLSRILVRQEALTSSAIEGTFSTLDSLLELENFDPSDVDASDAPTRQVRSYALALESSLGAVERNRADAFSIGLIRDLQREVVKDDQDYKYVPGEIRKHVVWIGGGVHISRSIYNPGAPETIIECLSHQIDYLRGDGMQELYQSILVRMAVAHAHFEAIHPFPDGNGRVGRLLLPLMLAAEGHTPLYIAPYIAAHRSTYVDGLRAAQQRLEYAPLIEILSRAIVSTVELAENAHSELFGLFMDWTAKRKWRKNSTARLALNLLPGLPVVTARRLASDLNVSGQAANSAIQQLVDARILTERTGYRRNRIFVAREVLDVFNRSP